MLSVIMSVFNADNYLRDSIESVLSQTYKDFEFIIINDGSNDKSLEIINSFCNKDSRIILINRENKGLIYSLNEGIKIAKGLFLARMDADDICLPNRFEEQIKFLNNNSEVGVCGSCIEIFGENIKSSNWKISSSDKRLKAELLFSSCFAHPSVMFNKKLLGNKIQYNSNFIHAEDFELWVRLSYITKFSNIKKSLLKYRVSNNSITRLADKDELKRYEILNKIFNYHLVKLNITNNEKENNIHFCLSENNRLRDNYLPLKDLTLYFNKLIKANNSEKVFNQYELKLVLGKKWLLNFIYKKDLKAIFSKYFFYALFNFFRV